MVQSAHAARILYDGLNIGMVVQSAHAARILCDGLNIGLVVQSAHAVRIVCDGLNIGQVVQRAQSHAVDEWFMMACILAWWCRVHMLRE